MSIGKLSVYDIKTGVWSSYIDRMEMYFKVNKVGDDLHLPTMIASMGDEAYELLVNLASPKKPSELSYQEADELMRKHLQPTPSALAERYRFRQKRQATMENVAAYVAELKKLSRNCKFGASLSENLRDQFVCGLKSDLIRQRLFAEDDSLTFVRAVRLATSLEAAERNAAEVEGTPGSAAEMSAVHALAHGPTGGGGRRSAVSSGSGERSRELNNGGAGKGRPTNRSKGSKMNNCGACGATNHSYGSCRFRDYVCSKCQRVGHLRRVCTELEGPRRGGPKGQGGQRRGFYYSGVDREQAQPHESSEEDDDPEESLNLLALNNYKAVSVPISINGKIINMEIDTGTAISCINKKTYDRYFRKLPIQGDNTVLKFYDGSKLKPLGLIRPLVRYEGQDERQLELFVIDGGTTSLVGRQWLAELNIIVPRFNKDESSLNNVCIDHVDKSVRIILDRYKEVFSGGLGWYTGGRATLRVREGAAPVFHRARPLPYALRERVDAELDAMLRAGVIEPVDCSDWASPLVPVNKADGTLRICADYKATVNPVLLIDRYPLPRIEDVLVGLNGAQFFSKIDLSQAYNQVELDESKKYTVINTHRGLFRYNRLVYGLSSSVGIFQRIMTNLFQGIPDVQVFLDDVIIGGKTKTDHLKALEEVLKKLTENGLKLKRQKCVFLVDEVTYLGYIISKQGVKADKSKINAILKIKTPGNVSELRSFLGMVNFFSKFIKNFSTILVPLNKLLRKGVEWYWDDECRKAFAEVKKVLTGTDVLAHYDPKRPLIVTCDASARGIGGVLSQHEGRGRGERPVAYVSRSLTPAEANYSQIHREALAIVFCMQKFHQYIYGRKFLLRTDHKPLVSILGPHTGIPTMTASRMQRWAVILSAYNYDIEYIKTDENCADGLSRLPESVKIQSEVRDTIPEQTYLHFAQDALLLEYSELKKETKRDPILGRVLNYIRNGWPEECEIKNLVPYFNRKKELYEELHCIMWGHRVVVPEACRSKVLKVIHEPHMGIVRSKALARSYVWWPGVDEAVESECRACEVCAGQADAPARALPQPWPWHPRPWTRLHLDFMGPIAGKTYLVVINATSKWMEVFHVPSTAASSTIGKLRELWSRWGMPRQIVSDNGPPFTSKEFSDYMRYCGISHVFTAPYHPSSNGAAENAVKTLKRVIKKAISGKTDIDEALNTYLMYYRNSEHTTTGETPSMLLIGRRLRTRLDALKPDVENKVRKAQQRQVESVGGVNRNISVGDMVWYRQYLKGEKWAAGTVASSAGKNDYNVLDSTGNRIHRHVDQIKRRSRSSLVVPTDSLSPSEPQQPEGSLHCKNSNKQIDLSEEQSKRPRAGSASPSRAAPSSPVVEEELFTTPPPAVVAPVPPYARPVRQCTLNKPSYKI